jgi:hypothetical protein
LGIGKKYKKKREILEETVPKTKKTKQTKTKTN